MLLTFNISCDTVYVRSDFIIFNLEKVIYANPTVTHTHTHTYIYIYIIVKFCEQLMDLEKTLAFLYNFVHL